ncbi:MAG: acyl-CoA reductase, partial [Gemmatimonadota bacterium]|nr:acyl-CoA reductase [Gemmatimonadota bacterium]
MNVNAFHLPALPHPATTTWSYGAEGGEIHLRVPRLESSLLRRQIEALIAARQRYLVGRSVQRIARVVDRVARRFADPSDSLRTTAEAVLPAVTGYSAPMIRRILDGMIPEWRMARLHELLRAELGDPRVLDGFRPRRGAPGRERAFGPMLATHIFSGNVPGVAVTSLIRSLLVKAATLGKTAVGEPVLPALFARGIAEEDAALGECIAVTYWPGGDPLLEAVALERAEVVVVYGGAEAVASARAATPPSARLLVYGPKLSFGMVAREALDSPGAAAEIAAAAALDSSTFDQQGCVSPHLFYVEEGGEVSPHSWAALLASEMAALETELPRGALSPSEASSIRQLRGEAEFAEAADGGVVLHASAQGTAWTVLVESDPAFTASCLNRVVRVKPIAELEGVADLVTKLSGLLQSVGIAAPPQRVTALAGVLGKLGASRVAPLGCMAWPAG